MIVASARNLYPIVQAVYKSEKFTLTCVTMAPPKWRRNGVGLITRYEGISDQSGSYDYTVRKATEKDSGNYSCSGIHSAGESFIATAEVVS